MKLKIIVIFDDGSKMEATPKKVEVVRSNGKNLAHFKHVENNPLMIFHIYVPTQEEPTTVPLPLEKEIIKRLSDVNKYKNSADELILQAKTKMLLPSVKCHYCGSVATNEYEGKKVCSNCASMLSKYGENSREFMGYLRTKLMNQWRLI